MLDLVVVLAGWYKTKMDWRYLTSVISVCLCTVGYSTESLLLYALNGAYEPLLILTGGSASIILCGAAALAVAGPTLPPVDRGLYLPVLLSGFIGSLSHLSFGLAIFSIGPGNATLLYYTSPIFVTILSAVFRVGSFKWTDVVFTGLSFVGVVLNSFSDLHILTGDPPRTTLAPSGIALALCGAVATAGELLTIKALTESGVHILVITGSFAVQYFVMTAVLCTVSGVWGHLDGLSSVFLVVPLAGLFQFVAIVLEYFAVSLGKPIQVAILLYLEVFITCLGELVVFDTPWEWTTFAASGMVVCACIGVVITHHEPEPSEGGEMMWMD